MKCIALLCLETDTVSGLEDYTACRLGRLLSSGSLVMCLAVSRKDFVLSENRATVNHGFRFAEDSFEEQLFDIPIEPAYVFFIHRFTEKEHKRCLDLLTNIAQRGIPTNYDADASSLGIKSVLEQRCLAYEMASGRKIPRPKTIIIRGDKDKTCISELMSDVGPCIIKPHNSSRSQGVSVLATQQQVDQLVLGTSFYVVQELLSEPFLIDGYKTGLRVYLMVYDLKWSYWLSEQGLVKLPAERYVRADSEAEIVGPHMKRHGVWPVIYLLKDLVNSAEHQHEWKPIRRSIEKTIDLFMESVSWRAGMFHRRFPTLQIWGVDLLIQRDGKELIAYLIEVNTFPALYREDEFTDGILDEVFAEELFAKVLV
jgi:hypothetical protein